MQHLAFYGPLLRTAWTITKDWLAAWAVLPGVILAVIPAIASVIVFEFVFSHEKQVSAVTWRVLRIGAEAVVGLVATVALMFLISVAHYAPHALIGQTAATASQTAKTNQEAADMSNCSSQLKAKDGSIAALQKQMSDKQRAFDTELMSQAKEQAHASKAAAIAAGALTLAQRSIPSNDTTYPFALEAVIRTSRPLASPISFFVICDNPIGRGDFGFFSPNIGMWNNGGSGYGMRNGQEMKTVFGGKLNSPDLDIDGEVTFRLYASTPLRVVGLESH